MVSELITEGAKCLSLMDRLQGFIAEVQCTAIMRLKYKEPDRHRAIALIQQGMVPGEHFREPDLVVITFAHLPAVDCDHIVVQPVTCRRMFIADGALCDFAFVVWELEVHASPVNVEFLAQVFGAHG